MKRKRASGASWALPGWLVCGAVAAAAALPEPWQSWRYSLPIDVPAGGAGALVSVLVPPEVTVESREGWTDLRVIDEAGREVPYVLFARFGGITSSRRPVRMLEPARIEGGYFQALVDTGTGGELHNSLSLGVQSDGNLQTWVEVAVSTDQQDWRVVRERAPIYVLRAEGMGEHTEVTYPDSVSRYLRVRVLDGSDRYRVTSMEVGYETTTEAEYAPAGVTLSREAGASSDSVWTSGDASRLPVSRVSFTTSQPAFFRQASVEAASADGAWRTVHRGDLLRMRSGAEERAWLTLDFPEQSASRWRVTVHNRNDSALADLAPAAMTTPRHVVFQREPGRSYRLIHGHPRARAPQYELANLTDEKAMAAGEPATLGPVEVNDAWVDPSPWTEKYDAVLWVALIAAVLVLGAVAIRTLRSSER